MEPNNNNFELNLKQYAIFKFFSNKNSKSPN